MMTVSHGSTWKNCFFVYLKHFIIFLMRRGKNARMDLSTVFLRRQWPGGAISLKHDCKDMLPYLEGESTYLEVFKVPKADFCGEQYSP